MTLNYVTLILDLFDGSGAAIAQGAATFAPSVQLTDPTDQEWIPPAPVQAFFRAGLAAPQVTLLATDNGNVQPNGWGWNVTFQNVPGNPAGFSFFLPHASGATQHLSAQAPVSSVTTMQAYMPLPAGTPTSGYVPVATGAGEATQWAPNGTGDSGYPALPAVSGTPTAGQVLTATSGTAADWQTPASGGGSVNSVTAGDTSIVVGGTGTNPTVETGTLDVIATDHPPAAAWSNNSKKITSVANGSAAQDAAAFGQVPTSAGSIGGLLAANNLSDVNSAATSFKNIAPLTTLGDLVYENATPAPARLAGSTSATKNFLTQTGNGTISAAPAWGTIAAGDVPTLNQSTTGNAANVTGTVAIGNGGTGQVTQQAALDALAGAQTSGDYLRGNGTHVVMAAIQAADVPTLNQATTASSGSCTGNAATATNLAGGATLPDYLAPAVSALTFGSSIAVNAALGNAFNLTLTASTGTLANPTNSVDGQVIRVRVTQGTGGSFTLAYGTAYGFGASGAPTLSTAAAKVDILGFEYVASISKWCYLGSGLGF